MLRAARKGMAMADNNAARDVRMDASDLWREEIITDRKIGTIRMMVPVKSDGAPDPARATVFTGEAQMMTNMGPLPISFDIEAKSLADAVSGYAAAAKVAIERTVRELQEMRREAASGLVLPGQAGGAFGPGGLPPGLGGGRGKIQMP
jgi:regulator of protease activity HflC (stomatin/prohibitin superfamily)